MKVWPWVFALLLAWSLSSLAGDLYGIVNGLPNAIDYLRGSWPPDFSILPSMTSAFQETLQMGFLGVSLGALVAVPLSFLLAGDTSPHWALYLVSRLIVGTCRSIPTLLWAIIFVAAMGLGPTSGIGALAVHCIGALGKLFSESIESMYPRARDMIDAMEIDGATHRQAMRFGLVPTVAPLFVSHILYYLEWSVRTSTILGLVGAGGLGLALTISIRMFRRQQTSAIVLAILVIVMTIDLFSRLVRKRILEATT